MHTAQGGGKLQDAALGALCNLLKLGGEVLQLKCKAPAEQLGVAVGGAVMARDSINADLSFHPHIKPHTESADIKPRHTQPEKSTTGSEEEARAQYCCVQDKMPCWTWREKVTL